MYLGSFCNFLLSKTLFTPLLIHQQPLLLNIEIVQSIGYPTIIDNFCSKFGGLAFNYCKSEGDNYVSTNAKHNLFIFGQLWNPFHKEEKCPTPTSLLEYRAKLVTTGKRFWSL